MATVSDPAQTSAPRENRTTLLLIAIFKLLKGLLLVGVGIGAVHLLHRDVAETVTHWVDLLRVDPGNRFIHRFLARVFQVSPKELRAVSAGTFVYAALLLTEGTGLLLRQRWAEYFTIITTGGLIPLEIYEIYEHLTAAKILVLLVNAAIVVYLVVQVKRHAAKKSG